MNQREIKFRAWHRDWSPQEVDKSDWHEEGKKINGMEFVKSLGYSKRNFWVHFANWESACVVKDGNVALMQYTGIKDRDGQEIYEGDIVECRGYKGEVKWIEDGFEADIRDKDGLRCYYRWGVVKVIGNIHENPELLK